MKRITNILLLTVTLLMTGCGGHYGIDDPNPEVLEGSYIFFDAGVTATKGTLISGTTLPQKTGTSFGVFGFRPNGDDVFIEYKAGENSSFDNVAKMYRQVYGGDFIYNCLALWHPDPEPHNFYAYYPYEDNRSIITEVGSDDQYGPYINYVQPTSLDAMADVVTAHTESTRTSDGVVNLSFDHRLFAFAVKVTNLQTQSTKDIVIKAASIEFQANTIPSSAHLYFEDTDQDGILDKATGNMMASSLNHIYEVNDTGVKAGKDYDLNSGNFFLFVPCPSLSVKISLTLVGAWGDEVTFTIPEQDEDTISDEYYSLVPLGGAGFQPGLKYFFNIKKSDKSIEFTLENADLPWNEN